MPPDPAHRPVPDDLTRTLATIRLDRLRQLAPRRGVVTTPHALADGSRAVALAVVVDGTDPARSV